MQLRNDFKICRGNIARKRNFKISNSIHKTDFYYKICQYFITVTVLLFIHSDSSKNNFFPEANIS